MKSLIKKIWQWLCTHKNWAHFIGGFGFGLAFGFDAAVAAAITSEVKDVQWGGAITVMDAVITMAGGAIGGVLHYFFVKPLFTLIIGI